MGKPPEQIGIGKLVRATENMSIVECFPLGKGACCIAGVCELQTVLTNAIMAFLNELDKVTLADLMKQKPALRGRLKIP